MVKVFFQKVDLRNIPLHYCNQVHLDIVWHGENLSVLDLMVIHLKGINYQQVWIFKYMVSLEALHWKYREDVRGYVTTVYSFLYSIYITKETNLLDT